MTSKTILPAGTLACLFVLGAVVEVAPAAEHTVRAGETLSRIARDQLGDVARWPEIARLNGLVEPYTIHVGQRLRLSGAVAPAAVSRSPELSSTIILLDEPLAMEEIEQAGSEPEGSANFRQALLWVIFGVIGLGILGTIVGCVMFYAEAFRQSVWWGLGSLFVPLVWLVFLVKYWDRAKVGFLVQGVASLVFAVGFWAMAHYMDAAGFAG